MARCYNFTTQDDLGKINDSLFNQNSVMYLEWTPCKMRTCNLQLLLITWVLAHLARCSESIMPQLAARLFVTCRHCTPTSLHSSDQIHPICIICYMSKQISHIASMPIDSMLKDYSSRFEPKLCVSVIRILWNSKQTPILICFWKLIESASIIDCIFIKSKLLICMLGAPALDNKTVGIAASKFEGHFWSDWNL